MKIAYFQSNSAEEAYKKAKSKITPEYLSEAKVKGEIKYDDRSFSISSAGKGFSLTLVFKDSYVEGDLKLGLLLKAFRKKIIQELEKRLKETV